ncbi:hypothetical protein G9A89_020097 [Geosiphon pyriformis]|nr:hypothetical protein G9A89_020097 [Geosiphon pyriformis]
MTVQKYNSFTRNKILRTHNTKRTVQASKQYKDLLGERHKELLDRMAEAAKYASLAYCLDEKDEAGPNIYVKAIVQKNGIEFPHMIVYLRGLEMTKEMWLKREIRLGEFSYENHLDLYDAFFYQFAGTKTELVFSQQFYLAENTITRKIISEASRTVGSIENIHKIKFIGHGLGGVYAVLSQIYYKQIWEFLSFEVYTFGQPRFGNGDFSRAINLQKGVFIHRITYGDDFVPRSPLHSQNRLVHHGHEYWIHPGNCDCRRSEEVFLCYGSKLATGFTLESSSCNNQYEDHMGSMASHLGPYFGYKMGQCSN